MWILTIGNVLVHICKCSHSPATFGAGNFEFNRGNDGMLENNKGEEIVFPLCKTKVLTVKIPLKRVVALPALYHVLVYWNQRPIALLLVALTRFVASEDSNAIFHKLLNCSFLGDACRWFTSTINVDANGNCWWCPAVPRIRLNSSDLRALFHHKPPVAGASSPNVNLISFNHPWKDATVGSINERNYPETRR